ncbi:MAG: chromo domain-containing protein, partial [Myxococcota bacterium]
EKEVNQKDNHGYPSVQEKESQREPSTVVDRDEDDVVIKDIPDEPSATTTQAGNSGDAGVRTRKSTRIAERAGDTPQLGSNKNANANTHAITSVKNNAAEAQEYIVDRIVGHGVNEDEEHPSAQVGETTYRVRWYGYGSQDDTYEPIHHLPLNKVVSYHKRKRFPLPDTLERAIAG